MGLVVGVGASAGGLAALKKLFKHMPRDCSCTFVVLQHLSPDYKSMMGELLTKDTDRVIRTIQGDMRIEPGCVYLLPPKKEARITGGVLAVRDFDAEESLHLPIDTFFHSLAQDQGENAVAIILSGTGSDGTRGLASIKKRGGLIIIQDPTTAQFDGMPNSAIATGFANVIAAPEEIGEKLMEFAGQLDGVDSPAAKSRTEAESLQHIFGLIRERMNLDLTYYKQNTVLRRFERRMVAQKQEDLEGYYGLLLHSETELSALCSELLIGVTRFFRDPKAFAVLEDKVIPQLLEGKRDGDTIRVWVAGCSTGEEAYSLAILLKAAIDASGRQLGLKVFATDIDRRALDTAATGIYSTAIEGDVPAPLLEKYFTKGDAGYHVTREIRDVLVFAQHNIIKDPPFTNIDLLACRNLLIYFQPCLQRKAAVFFKYALNDNGYLFLGPSETLAENDGMLEQVDNRWKIFARKQGSALSRSELDLLVPSQVPSFESRSRKSPTGPKAPSGVRSIDRLYQYLVHSCMQPALVVDEGSNAVLVCGRAGDYLTLLPGQPSLNVFSMLDSRPATALRLALRKAFSEAGRATFRYTQTECGSSRSVLVRVERLQDVPDYPKLCVVYFEEDKRQKNPPEAVSDVSEVQKNSYVQELEEELRFTKGHLQTTIEELETSNEELQASNEELLAANEELQSTNEELQAVNEELITLNSEYQQKILELSDLNNDLDNFLRITGIGVIFLDHALCVRKYTDEAAKLFNLMPQDAGRSIAHFSSNIKDIDIISQAEEVRRTLFPFISEVTDHAGRHFLMKIYPYFTRDSAVSGLTMTFVDVTDIR